MEISSLLHVLENLATDSDQLVGVTEIPARPGRKEPWPTWLDTRLVEAWQALGITSPWAHQVRGAQALYEGKHTVITTATGSGKSLAAWAPALNAVLSGGGPVQKISQARHRPTAIYVAPTKALAFDQLKSLEKVLAAGGVDLAVAAVDGDATREEKAWARAHANIIATNPDMLTYGILSGHERWARLLGGLRYVIIDEMHYYRGIFGAQAAGVWRRLQRVCAAYGAHPTFALLSATTSEPNKAAGRLLGIDPQAFTVIDEDTSAAGRRFEVRWLPGLTPDPESSEAASLVSPAQAAALQGGVEPKRISALSESARLAAALVENGAQVLAFSQARAGAEALATSIGEQLRRHGAAGQLAEAVAAYRGGYLPEERRELEAALNTGQIRALASTNALELGIDIHGLDAVITCGFPGSRASWRQQAGRSGRAGAQGLAVLVADEDPLDHYLVRHPEALYGQVEALIFDPENPYVLVPHLAAAAAELPLQEADFPLFFPSLYPQGLPADPAQITTPPLIEQMIQAGLLRRRPGGYYWNAARPESPWSLVNLRGSDEKVQIVEADSGTLLGDADKESALFSLYLGAVYVHQGRTYRVTQRSEEVALVRPCAPYWRTRPLDYKQIEILQVKDKVEYGDYHLHYGMVRVATQLQNYQLLRLPGALVQGTYPVDAAPTVLETAATWWTLTDQGLEKLRQRVDLSRPDALAGTLHAAEHALIGMLPLLATCDRWDLGGLSAATHPDSGAPTIFVHDGAHGGAGFSQRGYQQAATWAAQTATALATCPCEGGCPSCVQSPKCGNANEPLDKSGAQVLLELLRESF